MKIIIAIAGIFAHLLKFFVWVVEYLWTGKALSPNQFDVAKDRWGWWTPHMRVEWARFALDRHNFLHLAKNIWVEWLEQDKERLRAGLVMIHFAWVMSTICAFVLGALIF